MKVIDTTKLVPVIIGGTKEKWLFRCDTCGYQAFFILWKGSGMSTGCERCGGDMERKYKAEDLAVEFLYTTKDGVVNSLSLSELYWSIGNTPLEEWLMGKPEFIYVFWSDVFDKHLGNSYRE